MPEEIAAPDVSPTDTLLVPALLRDYLSGKILPDEDFASVETEITYVHDLAEIGSPPGLNYVMIGTRIDDRLYVDTVLLTPGQPVPVLGDRWIFTWERGEGHFPVANKAAPKE